MKHKYDTRYNGTQNISDSLKPVQNKAVKLQDNRYTTQLKKQNKTDKPNGLQTIQLFTSDDMKYMYHRDFGLRHHDSKLGALSESINGTEGGDAVPLNPTGETIRHAYTLSGKDEVPQELIESFIQKVENFISKSLSRTVKMKLGISTPRQIISEAVNKSTFLLISGLENAKSPRDVHSNDYAGLGKVGKQRINPNQIVHLMSLNDNEVDMEFMELVHGKNIDTPIETEEEGDEVFSNLVLIISEKLKDAVYKLRTGNDRFMI